jgi:lipopolysaccharide transport system ATP-binding protein
MPQPAIRVSGLCKQYVVGSSAQPPATLYDVLTSGLRAPLRRMRGEPPRPKNALFWALQDVDFEVGVGEVVGVVGRNGAGKSTLLKLLSRITAPTRGRIEMRGRLSSLLEVGTGFHPELSGRENIYLNGAILGMSAQEVNRNFDEIVDFAEIDDFVDTPVKRYSSGMYVRLAFSVAAHLDPDILIVDEVLAVGDMQFQKRCLGKLEKVAQGGRAVIFVSHNLSAIESLCTKAILLDKGRLVHQGPVLEVTEKYISASRTQVLFREFGLGSDRLENGTIRVTAVGLKSDDGTLLDTISSEAPFLIEISYEVHRAGSMAGLTVVLYDSHNNIVFCSINNHEPNWYGRAMPEGRYRSTCRIPANLLNQAWYRLGLNIFGKNFSDSQFVHEILVFEVKDGGSLRGDYYGEIGGAVRPLLDWQTEAEDGRP